MLDLDYSVLIIMSLVWILMVVLNKIFYRPVGNMLAKRENKVREDSEKLQSLTADIQTKTDLIEKILKDAKKDSINIREELIQKGEQIREQLIGDARQKSKHIFDQSMDKLAEDINTAEQELTGEIEEFSRRMKEIFL
jgi:F-type H+-transporting ATPase subunit b